MYVKPVELQIVARRPSCHASLVMSIVSARYYALSSMRAKSTRVVEDIIAEFDESEHSGRSLARIDFRRAVCLRYLREESVCRDLAKN